MSSFPHPPELNGAPHLPGAPRTCVQDLLLPNHDLDPELWSQERLDAWRLGLAPARTPQRERWAPPPAVDKPVPSGVCGQGETLGASLRGDTVGPQASRPP